ncbi:MAG: hypothetical protein K5751_11340 [Treponemataceae bacterium]|nr:hypothetical protein [Treponemataceae bacterium]
MRVLKLVTVAAILFVASVNLFAQSAIVSSQHTSVTIPSSQRSVSLTSSDIPTQFPSIEPLFTAEEELGYSPDKILTADEILTLSLLFSECSLSSVTARRAFQKFERIKKEVSSPEYMQMSEEERGKAILMLLYKNTLFEYNEDQSKINTVFETGYYNCVSSALIYMAAAKAARLEVRGQKTPEHAFCSIYIKNKTTGKKHRIDVETTNPYGFNSGTTGTIDYGDNMKLYYSVPASDYENRQEVSDKVFVGLVANNLCADYQKSGDYYSAIPSMGALYDLVKNEKSSAQHQIQEDFFGFPCSYIHDVSIDLDSYPASKYEEIVSWFASFIKRWGKNSALQDNMDAACNNLIYLCFQEKNYDLANTSFSKLKPYISKKQLAESQEIITEILITSKTDGAEPYQKTEIIYDLLNSADLSSAQRKRLSTELENTWLIILTERMNNCEFREGYQDSLTAQTQLPESETFKQTTQIFYTDCIIDIHNAFVTQANSGNFKEAIKILEQGLSEFPDDQTLLNDVAILKSVGLL